MSLDKAIEFHLYYILMILSLNNHKFGDYVNDIHSHWVDTWWANGDVSPSQMAEQKCDF